MSWKLSGLVLETGLPLVERFILLAYAECAHDDGRSIYPSNKRVAWRTGASVRTVQRVRDKLATMGLLKFVGYRTKGGVKVFRMNVKALNELAERNRSKLPEPFDDDTEDGIETASPPMTACHPPHDTVTPPPCQPVTPPMTACHPPHDTVSPKSSLNSQRTVKESSSPTGSDCASEIYAIYPRKVGRPAALKAITKALKKHPVDYLLDRTSAYSAAVRRWPEDAKQFIPHPATWFNQERFDDDPSTWERNGHSNGHVNGNVVKIGHEKYETEEEHRRRVEEDVARFMALPLPGVDKQQAA